MEKEEVIRSIRALGIVAVIRGKDEKEAVSVADACIAGGVGAIEITFTTPRAHEVIRELTAKYKGDASVIIGAGTVLDATTARIAILEGAKFIVSPTIDLEVIKLCNRYRVVCMPGTTTLDGVVAAMEAGADIVKIFPGEIVGVQMIKAIKGPMPQAQLMPTGGVTVENAAEWLRAGCVAVGAGGSLTGAAKDGNFAEVTKTAARFIQAVAQARAAL